MNIIKLTQTEIKHLKWLLEDNGYKVCKCCSNIYKKLNSQINEETKK